MSSRPSRGAARLAAILDALPDALLLVNCNGTVVNANSIALEVFESPGTALVGRGLLDLLPDFDSKLIPGSMRRPDDAPQPRTKPTRMVARRTDGTQFMVEVTSANLEDGRTPYESSFEAAFADHGNSYTGDELLMLVVRDLTGTVDTEAELARQQRQTEMILRAAAEGVVGVDTEGRVVLVNPAAAQILGYRAGELGGQKLHPLVHHSRPDGSQLPWEETPLADSLRSGRKHRVRGQVLWTKSGRAVPVDMTTAPVRDGDQLVGAVLAFTDRTAYDALAARHEQLLAVLESGLRGPLEQLRGELGGLAADPAGQLWPEANQTLHYLAAGYARMTTLVDNVLGYQRLDAGAARLARETVSLDEVVSAGVEGAIELIGPGRAQFAVHAPPVEVEVDPVRLAQALAHLVADVAGVDATGNAQGPASGDSTIVVAAAQRGDVVRIEVRGPYGGGSPVHEPLVRGIVRRHGGVLQTHQVPGAGGGSAYVLEVPVGSPDPAKAAARRKRDAREQGAREQGAREQGAQEARGERGPETGGTQGSLDTRAAQEAQAARGGGETTVMPVPSQPVRGTPAAHAAGAAEAAAGGAIALPPGSRNPAETAAPDDGSGAGAVPSGGGRRRARRALAQGGERTEETGGAGDGSGEHALPSARRTSADGADASAPSRFPQQSTGTGRRARRAAPGPEAPAPAAPAQAPGRAAFALPPGPTPAPNPAPNPAAAPQPVQPPAQPQLQPVQPQPGQHQPAQPQPAQHQPVLRPEAPAVQEDRPTGRRRRVPPPEETPRPAPAAAEPQTPGSGSGSEQHTPAQHPEYAEHPQHPEHARQPEHDDTSGAGDTSGAEQPAQADLTVVAGSPILGGAVPPEGASRQRALPMPGSEAAAPEQTSGVSVRTLGQGVPFARQVDEQHTGRQAVQQPAPPAAPPAPAAPAMPPAPQPPTQAPAPGPTSTPAQSNAGPGRRRKLAAPPAEKERAAEAAAAAVTATPPQAQPQYPPAQHTHSGREFAIGAPEAGAEGPEHLDGPGGAVEVTGGSGQVPLPADDELPPEPLDNPRRLLVWPEPDVSTQQALTDRGYRPVIVHSREEVDAQIAAYPAALFVDPLTGPITRTALQSLRQAAVAAEVPVLVTAGLGVASREAAYGADPAVLLKALAPRDSEQHPPRVLLVEEHAAIADAMAATLGRRGMQTAHAPSDAEAVQLAAQIRPNLVVMDLMQVRRRRAGIIDWLRVNGMLNRTPFVVYTSASIDEAELPGLASGETVLFLAERSTSPEVQARIVDLLAKIGAN